MPKRQGNLFEKIVSTENLNLAIDNAAKGKRNRKDVSEVLRNREKYLKDLETILTSFEFKTSKYKIFDHVTIEGKHRKIYSLPFFPDRIVHHAIIQVCGGIWTKSFIRNTYACVPGRGIHDAVNRIRAVMPNMSKKYVLKCDIKKYFPSIDHEILKIAVRRKIKDKQTLNLLDDIIDSAVGLPVGNYLSQYFGNLVLNSFDHWIKSTKRCKNYYRYCDDFIIFDESKEFLHRLRIEIEDYLGNNLKLKLKNNWQVFPVDASGVDFVGYRFWPDKTLLRKTTIKRYKERIRYKKLTLNKIVDIKNQMGCFRGWLKYCSSSKINYGLKYKKGKLPIDFDLYIQKLRREYLE